MTLLALSLSHTHIHSHLHKGLNTTVGETTAANEVLISQLQRPRFLYAHNVLVAVINGSNNKDMSYRILMDVIQRGFIALKKTQGMWKDKENQSVQYSCFYCVRA